GDGRGSDSWLRGTAHAEQATCVSIGIPRDFLVGGPHFGYRATAPASASISRELQPCRSRDIRPFDNGRFHFPNCDFDGRIPAAQGTPGVRRKGGRYSAPALSAGS